MKPEYQAIIDEHGIWPNGFAPFNADTPSEWDERLARGIDHCVEFLRQLPRVKRFTRCSYGLKHNAERWAGEYVCNGALIVAAFYLGIPVRRYPHGGPNCELPIGASSRWPRGVWARVSRSRHGEGYLF